MTIVSQTPALMPSILSMVKRVKRECGLPQPTTLVSTTDQDSLVVLDALNDATTEIYMRKRWETIECLYGVPLVAAQTQYALPADFGRMATGPKSAGVPMTPYTHEEWQRAIPAVSTNIGQPIAYTAYGLIFEVWPPPSTDYVTSYPVLQFSYYRMPPSRLDGTDDDANINLPPEFEECLISFAKWKLKAKLEYPDAEADHARYERTLQIQMDARRSIRKTARMRQTGTVSSKIWS